MTPKEKAAFKVDESKCIHCGRCVAVCTGMVLHPDADGIHIQGTLSIPFVDVEAIRKCKFKVAVDAVNGAGSYIVPRLLEELGCEVVRVHCKPDGTFPRGAEPIPENLGDLRDAVKKNGCALGFAVDPDADRCALVDGLGQSIGEEYTLAIATEEVLSQKKGATCVNLSTSRMNEDVAEKYGCECSRAKVGEINVSLQMIETLCMPVSVSNGAATVPANVPSPATTPVTPGAAVTFTAALICAAVAFSYSPSPRSVFSLTSMTMFVTSLTANPE